MRDLMELIYETQEANGNAFAAIHDEICKEVKKGTDFNPYLSCTFSKSGEYNLTLRIPVAANLFK